MVGDWKTKPVSLQVKTGATPYHRRAYPVPKVHLKVLKKELKRLCDLGVLEWLLTYLLSISEHYLKMALNI